MTLDRVLVVGCGFVGQAVATRLREASVEVVGTTTTEAKRDGLLAVCDDVVVLRGSDAAALHAAAAGVDAIVAAAGPAMARSQTPEQRAESYQDVLVDTAGSIATAPGDPHLVALSSLSVYGAAADDRSEVDEDGPLTTNPDPSPQCFQAAERRYLGTGRAAVLRCADVYGPGDPPVEDKIRMVHQYMGGSVPFRAEAYFYRVHVDDVAAAVVHALEERLVGAFNLTHAGIPARNGEVFDRVSTGLGLPPLVYRGEIESPAVPVSVARLTASGFTCSSTTPVT